MREVGSVDINEDGDIGTTPATWLDEAVPDPPFNIPLNPKPDDDTLKSYNDWSLMRLPLERGGLGGNGQLCITQWESDALVEGQIPCDCNRNRRADWRDIQSGASADVDVNGVPDECQRPRVTGLPAEVTVCPGGDGEGFDFWMDFDNLCTFDRNSSYSDLRAVLRRGTGSTVQIWAEWGEPAETFPVSEFGFSPARARFAAGVSISGEGTIWFDLISRGAVVLSSEVVRVRSFDQDAKVEGAVDKFDSAALVASYGAGPNLPYDLNQDGEVDDEDLALLVGHLGHSQSDLGITYPSGGSFSWGAFIPVSWQPGMGDSARAILKLGRLFSGGPEQELARNLLDDGGELWPAYVTDARREDYYLRLIRTAGVWDGTNSYGSGTSLFSTFTIEAAGGCPQVDVLTPFGWTAENTILGRSLSGEMGLDSYRMLWAPSTDSIVRVRIRENESEVTVLDDIRLIAIDHSPDSRVFASGDEVVAGQRIPAASVATSRGIDITALVGGSGPGYGAVAGDTIYVSSSGSLASDGIRAITEGEGGPIIIDDGGGKGGPQQHFAGRPMSASEVDEQILRSTGILVQQLGDDGAWATVAHHYPRERPSEALFEQASSHAVRLVFLDGHRVNFLGRLARDPSPLSAVKLTMLSGVHSRLGDVSGSLTSTGNLTTTLESGDTLSLAFVNTPLVPGLARDYFLLSRGVYTSSLPAGNDRDAPRVETPPLRFSLGANRPNPFAQATMFTVEVPASVDIRLEIFDLEGRLVRRLLDAEVSPGRHNITWDRLDDDGGLAKAGIYFYRLTAPGFSDRRRMVLLP